MDPAGNKLLSVIIPVRIDSERHDVLARLHFARLDESSKLVDFIIVDDGSLGIEAKALREKCAELGYQYASTGAFSRTFSIGRARNIGVQTARTQFVMFQDVDLMPCSGFYAGVLREIAVQGLEKYAERFLMFGVIYLTQDATQEFRDCTPELRQSQFIQYLLDNNEDRIEKFSTGTSVITVSREYFLASGGMDSDFEGWGFEDLEFTCRMLRRNRRFPLPAEFDRDYRNFRTIHEYRGWKATYRLFGDITFSKGLVLFHAWHPVYADSAYMGARSRNLKMFQKKLAAFRQDQIEPSPLPKPERGRSLAFRRNPFVMSRWVAPSWGEIVLIDEDDFDSSDLLDFIRNRGITRVVFHNPFANDRMEQHYRAIQKASIEYVVCERGALPGSTFFDPCGFNGDSSSYDPARWNRPLENEERRRIVKYVQNLVAGSSSLEAQPEKVGLDAVRRQLGIPRDKKVLFVPLQRPSDTVISKLSEPVGGFAKFLELVRETVERLDPDWEVVAKRHPLEADDYALPGVTWGNECHIHDLLDLADAVLVINSGVGVLSLAHEKPVLVAGTAFYDHPGLARQVVRSEEVLEALTNFRPDREKVLRFLHYLVFEFYSFGHFKTREVAWTDGAKMTATVDIEYTELRTPGQTEVVYERRQTTEVSEASILFDRYRRPNGEIAREASSTKPPQANGQGAPTRSNHADSHASSRKLRKLQENPRAFLEDSRFAALRGLGKLLD